MAFPYGQREIFPPGYLLEDAHGVPEEYEFPPYPWTPGEGLIRSTNLALKESFRLLAYMYNSMRRRRIMEDNDLSSFGVSCFVLQDVVSLIQGDQGVFSLQRQILAMGGQPMPIPDQLAKVWKEHLKREAYDDVSSKPLAFLKPATHIVKCQEFAKFSLIDEKIQMPTYLRGYSINSYLKDHYEEMARLYNKVLSNRHKAHLLPPSYNRTTKELADILLKMREVAEECIEEVRKAGGLPFWIPEVLNKDKLVVLSLFEDTYGA